MTQFYYVLSNYASEVFMATVHPKEEVWKVVYQNNPDRAPNYWILRQLPDSTIFSESPVEQILICDDGPQHKVVFADGFEKIEYLYHNEITKLGLPTLKTISWYLKRWLKRVKKYTVNIIRGFR
jgi:hypothetical protein